MCSQPMDTSVILETWTKQTITQNCTLTAQPPEHPHAQKRSRRWSLFSMRRNLYDWISATRSSTLSKRSPKLLCPCSRVPTRFSNSPTFSLSLSLCHGRCNAMVARNTGSKGAYRKMRVTKNGLSQEKASQLNAHASLRKTSPRTRPPRETKHDSPPPKSLARTFLREFAYQFVAKSLLRM